MFRFEEPSYLWLLLLIPALCALRFLLMRQQKKRWRRFGDPVLIKQLAPDVSLVRRILKFILLMVALALLIVMLARPQMGTKISKEKRQGIETVIALDVSNSMLAQDVEPSRLEKSKLLVENLVDHFDNDRIGLIVFAGDAFVQLPITSDYVSAKMFLSSISPEMIETQGTDVAAAINMAANSFTQEQNIGKAIIVITDGENHEGGAEEAAREAAEKGMQVFVLGVGSPEGAPIPGDKANDYRKDKDGNVIVTRLNEQMCQDISKAGNGAYIRVDNTNAAQKLLKKELDKLAKADQETTVYSDFDEQFVTIAWMALALLVAELLISLKKNPLFKNVKLFE